MTEPFKSAQMRAILAAAFAAVTPIDVETQQMTELLTSAQMRAISFAACAADERIIPETDR